MTIPVSDWRLEGSDQFCLTITAQCSPPAVLVRYGADPTQARLLTASEVDSEIEADFEDSILRAGELGAFSFCIEFGNPVGFLDGIVGRLSAGTEAIILYRLGNALKGFHHVIDGCLVEYFEPGLSETVWGVRPLNISQQVDRLIGAENPVSPLTACLQVIGEYIGRSVSAEILRGKLMTSVLHSPNRALLAEPLPELRRTAPAGTSTPLGRRLN